MGNSHSAKALWGSDSGSKSLSSETPQVNVEHNKSVADLQMSSEIPNSTPPTQAETVLCSSAKPGNFDELHKPVKDLAFVPYEGLRFTANRGLSSHFQVQHTVNLSNETSAYRFGATYVGTKQPSPTEAYPIMVGEMNTSGDLQAQLIHLFGKSIKFKCVAQTKGPKIKSLQAGADVQLGSSSISLLAADPDVFNKSGMFIAQYLQGLTPNLAVGADIIYQRSPVRQNSIVSFAARYRMPQWQIASTVGSAGVHFSFYRKANDNVQVGVEFEAARKNLESITSLCYQMDIPKMNLLFRGMVNSEWTIGSSFEKRLLPFPIALNMTATYNIKQDKTTVGLGATLG